MRYCLDQRPATSGGYATPIVDGPEREPDAIRQSSHQSPPGAEEYSVTDGRRERAEPGRSYQDRSDKTMNPGLSQTVPEDLPSELRMFRYQSHIVPGQFALTSEYKRGVENRLGLRGREVGDGTRHQP